MITSLRMKVQGLKPLPLVHLMLR